MHEIYFRFKPSISKESAFQVRVGEIMAAGEIDLRTLIFQKVVGGFP